MIRLTVGKPFTRSSTSFLYPLRNASTGKVKSKGASKLKRAKSSDTPQGQPGVGSAASDLKAQSASRTRLHNDQSWTIEPKLGYWRAKIKTPLSRGVLVSIVSLAATSVATTAMSMPNPDTLTPPPSTLSESVANGEDIEPPQSQRSFLDLLLSPVTFIFRPVLVPEQARAEARKTWLFWVGQGAGYTAFLIFGVAFFFTPRHTRSLTISPIPLNPKKGGMLRFTPAWGRPVTCPLGDTILVSPIVLAEDRAVKSKTRDVLRTVSVEGNTLRGALLGWGLPMLKNGAVVNGKDVSQGEVIKLLERIWLQRGGEIGVDDERRTFRGLFSKKSASA